MVCENIQYDLSQLNTCCAIGLINGDVSFFFPLILIAAANKRKGAVHLKTGKSEHQIRYTNLLSFKHEYTTLGQVHHFFSRNRPLLKFCRVRLPGNCSVND